MSRMPRHLWKTVLLLIALAGMVGCAGGHKATGKYSNLDKPKPVETPK